MDALQQPSERKSAPLTLQVTWPFIVMVLLLATIATASLQVLSVVRTFVAGESHWTKGQKDAIYHLHQYAINGAPQAYEDFLRAMDIPLGGRAARVALQSEPMQLDAARAGFVRAGHHPDDIDSMIWMLRYFDHLDFVRKPMVHWLVGDEYLNALRDLADEIHQRSTDGTVVNAATRQRWQDTIQAINAGVTPVAHDFNRVLGESSRHIVHQLMWINAGMAALLIVLTLWHTHSLLQQRRRVEQALEAEREQARTTLTAIGDGVVTTDTQGQVVYMNPAAEVLLARTAAQTKGQPLAQMLVLGDEAAPLSADTLVHNILHSDTAALSNLQTTLVRPDQSTVSVKLVGTPIRHRGALSGAVLVLHDVTREQHYVEQLSWQASHDALTGLVNRREFERRLQSLLSQPRAPGREGSLLYADMDQFKLINDTCGHQAGDEMLREVCRMLQGHLREGDTLARLGGDEFGILLEDCPAEPSARIAEQLRHAAQGLRHTWEGQQLTTSLSIGMVQLVPALTSIQEAMRVADMACYRAKEGGRNRVVIYQPEDIEMSRREGEMDWVRRLRLALEQNRFQLHAQTITPLQPHSENSQHIGLHMEVLLRLREDDGKLCTPGSFIPAAEHYGMMPHIDHWVIDQTLEALARYQRQCGHTPVHTCAINLSGASLGDDKLFKHIHSALKASGVDPCVLCFEITETSAISHLPDAVRLMKELQQLGCRFALDDFGVGMSSFNYLRHLPVDYLKIDGSFVKEMLHDTTNRAMVEMIHRIGHVMGKQTIAEFAESQAIVDALRDIGVDYAQGYALAPPMPLDDYLATAINVPS